MPSHDTQCALSVRKIKTDATPPPLANVPFWKRLDWSTLIPITVLLLQIAGAFWLSVVTVLYAQAWGLIATLPHAAFLPVYAFLTAYGALRWEKGDKRTLYRCTGANALLLASY